MPDYFVIKVQPPSLGGTPAAKAATEMLRAAPSSSRAQIPPPGGGRGAEFFSDDVVVDFPSLERAIERIRVGFEIAEIERQIS